MYTHQVSQVENAHWSELFSFFWNALWIADRFCPRTNPPDTLKSFCHCFSKERKYHLQYRQKTFCWWFRKKQCNEKLQLGPILWSQQLWVRKIRVVRKIEVVHSQKSLDFTFIWGTHVANASDCCLTTTNSNFTKLSLNQFQV